MLGLEGGYTWISVADTKYDVHCKRVASSRGDINTSDTCTIDPNNVRYITIGQLHKEDRARIALHPEYPPWGPGCVYPFGGWVLGGALNPFPPQKKRERGRNTKSKGWNELVVVKHLQCSSQCSYNLLIFMHYKNKIPNQKQMHRKNFRKKEESAVIWVEYGWIVINIMQILSKEASLSGKFIGLCIINS